MSLKIYYTGADKAGSEQKDPKNSLGGYISSSLVPNNFIGNLYAAISQLSEQELREDTKVIAIKNDTGADFTAFDVYIGTEDESKLQTEWQIGYMAAALDDCGDIYFEKLENAQSLPLNVTMQNGLGVNNKLTLPNMVNATFIALYIQRKVKSSGLTTDDRDWETK